MAAHVADHGHGRHLARLFAPLVDDGQRCADPGGQFARPGHAAHIGRDDHQVVHLATKVMLDIQRKDGCCIQVVDRDVEKALDLGCVQVQRQHPVDPRLGDQVRHQLGADRRAGLGAAILPGITEIGDHGGNAAGAGPAQRINHDQKLHQVVVCGVRGRLDDIHILAAHVLEHLDKDFLVVEPFDPRLDQVHAHPPVHRHPPGDRPGQGQVGVSGDQLRFGDGGHGQPIGDGFVTRVA